MGIMVYTFNDIGIILHFAYIMNALVLSINAYTWISEAWMPESMHR